MKRLFSFTAAVFALLLAFSPCTGSSCLSRTPRSSAFWGAAAFSCDGAGTDAASAVQSDSAPAGAAVMSAYQGEVSARFTSQKESDVQVVLNSSGKFRPSTRNRAGASDVLSKSRRMGRLFILLHYITSLFRCSVSRTQQVSPAYGVGAIRDIGVAAVLPVTVGDEPELVSK